MYRIDSKNFISIKFNAILIITIFFKLVFVCVELLIKFLNIIYVDVFLLYQRAYAMALLINSINLLAYCSGSHVEIPSTLLPYLTVLAALAA